MEEQNKIIKINNRGLSDKYKILHPENENHTFTSYKGKHAQKSTRY